MLHACQSYTHGTAAFSALMPQYREARDIRTRLKVRPDDYAAADEMNNAGLVRFCDAIFDDEWRAMLFHFRMLSRRRAFDYAGGAHATNTEFISP